MRRLGVALTLWLRATAGLIVPQVMRRRTVWPISAAAGGDEVEMNRFSKRITQPREQGASQAMLYATGLTEEDMHKVGRLSRDNIPQSIAGPSGNRKRLV